MHYKKIFHIHIDKKFIYSTLSFVNDEYINTNIYIGNDPPRDNKVERFKPTITSCKKLISTLNESADLVVFWGLDYKSAYIINRLSPNLQIMWRFFGFELYPKLSNSVYSDTTQKYLYNPLNKFNPKKILAYATIKLNWYKIDFEVEINNAIKRCNYIMGVSNIEYQYLLKSFPDLPQFIQYPFHMIDLPLKEKLTKQNKIIIGNSRSPFNNHLDIIKRLLKLPHDIQKDYSFLFFLNYGPKAYYSKKVMELGAQLPKSEIIIDFIPKHEYEQYFSETSALVINSYRQHAIGNIFIAMKYHLKIYLNPKNIAYKWLLKEGFIISPVQELIGDILNNRVALSEEELERNYNVFKNFKEKYSKEKFQATLRHILNK